MKMTHREIYEWLLHVDRREALLAQVRLQVIGLDMLDPSEMRVAEAQPLPYVLLGERTDDPDLKASCTSLYLDLRPLAAPRPDSDFYFPLIAAADPDPVHIRHEVQHLHDLLDLCQRMPKYPYWARRSALGNITRASQIKESADLEVFKIFTLEPQAFRLDYEGGETTLPGPVLWGVDLTYRTASEDEFVNLRVAGYVMQLDLRFLKKFPREGDRIRKAIRVAANRHGRDFFGPEPYQRAEALYHQMRQSMASRLYHRSAHTL